jgi:catechol 2,3-dioxygenase-like lactoylglutathione lyase family enzyme
MLNQCGIIGFIPTKDAARARAFYVDLLGLELVGEDNFALVVKANGTMVRIVILGEFTPVPYTILGWEVPDIGSAAVELAQQGVVFERFAYFEQDGSGIWTAPDGSRVAWFKDPDGNTLSISQHLA